MEPVLADLIDEALGMKSAAPPRDELQKPSAPASAKARAKLIRAEANGPSALDATELSVDACRAIGESPVTLIGPSGFRIIGAAHRMVGYAMQSSVAPPTPQKHGWAEASA